MKHALQMYRMVKIVHAREVEIRQENKGADLRKIIENQYPKAAVVTTAYMKKYNVSVQESHDIYNDAIARKFLKEMPLPKKSESQLIWPVYVKVDTEGRDLISTIPFLPFVPINLWLYMFNRYWQFFTVIIALIVFPKLIELCKWAISHFFNR